ncbi:DHH family phosphoesterase [Thermodesulfobacteriota bacterium]
MTVQLIAAMKKAIQEVNTWPEKSVQLFHHNDSDGLTSGAILTRTFERKGFDVKRFCLEKPYPAILKRVFHQKGKLIVFTDFAGRIAPLISDLNNGKNLTLILDHHKANPSTDPMVHNLDPELFGLKGDLDITASTTCYLFAKAMDPANRDLAYIATIGAVGDQFFLDGRLATQNREVALETQRQGLLEIREHDAGETYILLTPKGPVPCDELGFYLDTLGAAGYYQDGPDMGIQVCLEGKTPESDQMLEQLRDIQTRIFKDQIKRIRQGEIKQTKHIQWFHVQERFNPMGVKMIGAFCDMYKETKGFDPKKYIAGFQVIPNKIPGFGPITFDEVKISMRAPVFVEEEIRAGRMPGLDTFLPEATGNLGGFSDACHSLTAATTLAIGKEEALIAEIEKILTAQ